MTFSRQLKYRALFMLGILPAIGCLIVQPQHWISVAALVWFAFFAAAAAFHLGRHTERVGRCPWF